MRAFAGRALDPGREGGDGQALLASLAPALHEVIRPRAAARPLPRAAFVDPASLALDALALFRGRWMAAASAADVAEPGAWARVGWPGRGDLIVARGAGLDLALLSAVCRHRGVPLVEGDAGRVRELALACPYHGWTYDLGGRLRRAPGLDEGRSDAGDLGLHAGETSMLGHEVLARLDPRAEVGESTASDGAPPDLPPWLAAAPLGALRRVHQRAHDVAANWKLVVANFQEAHHFPRVHPGLEARTPFATSASVIPEGGGWLGGTMELAADRETVSGTGRRDGRPFLAAAPHRRRVHDAWIAPNLLTSLQPDYLLTYRLEPRAVDRTRVVFAIDVHASARPDAIAEGLADLVAFWTRTNDEDRAIVERQHGGLTAAPTDFRCGPYAASEDGLHAFEARIAAAYLALLERPTDEAP